MRVIAVDDENGALKLLCRAVAEAKPDAELHAFQSSTEALAFARAAPPDVAFLDIRMPEISGLELAKKLKKINPAVNIIFATSYSDCAVDAMRLHSSGYLLKPVTKEDVINEFENLRNPVVTENCAVKRLYARTFGNFDLFCDGKPVVFHRGKTKELLAYLIDCQGSSSTRKQIAAAIFEDGEYSRSTQTYLSQIIKDLNAVLKELGVNGLLVTGFNSYAVNRSLLSCDAYDYLEGKPEALNAFRGEYMLQYSWGEYSLSRFYE